MKFLWRDEKSVWCIAVVDRKIRITAGDVWVEFHSGSMVWHGMPPSWDMIPDNVFEKVEYFNKIKRLL